ncbi:hypothetical protein F4802DRAFT_476417 [Xylaria palmicola]|nr:hypothetical protein F4802DRAFT_476417 [Xylaria palmicola]
MQSERGVGGLVTFVFWGWTGLAVHLEAPSAPPLAVYLYIFLGWQSSVFVPCTFQNTYSTYPENIPQLRNVTNRHYSSVDGFYIVTPLPFP